MKPQPHLQDYNSRTAYLRACELIPGGVNSPARAAIAVGRSPLFIKKAQGSYVWDIDGNRFIDYVGSFGPMILGHAHPAVVKAVQTAAKKGLSFGAPTEAETELAQELLAAFPSMDMVRLVNSGTEATMSALRLARAATGRELIVKFEGCYHGHSDALLVKAGSGALTMGVSSSAGVPKQTSANTIVAEYNNIEGITAIFAEYGERIAAVIVEPIAGNMGVVLPRKEFLPTLCKLTETYGSLLIFDEVMTGFRVAFGGAQTLYNLNPDITCLGKIIGGGLPLAAYGAKKHIMEQVSPIGPMYQAGTLSGNPLAVSAGLASIKLLKKEGFYDTLNAKAAKLVKGIRDIAAHYKLPVQVNHQGALFSLFFTRNESTEVIRNESTEAMRNESTEVTRNESTEVTEASAASREAEALRETKASRETEASRVRKVTEVADFRSACASDSKRFASFYQAMLEAGIYLPPSQFEAWFISAAHSDKDIEATLQGVERAFSAER